MALLGDDGYGYELARKLESEGVWRTWLGDELYPNFAPFLSSPSSWEVFMKPDDSKTRAEMQLQLRVRALLFDKAVISAPQLSGSSSSAISKLNPDYLQLHGDDVYYTLDDCAEDETQQRDGGGSAKMPTSKMQPKEAINVGSRYVDRDMDNTSRPEEFPQSWYSQFFKKYRETRPYRLSFGEPESDKRTPEQMAAYLRIHDSHKRKRMAFKEEETSGFGNSLLDNGSKLVRNSVMGDYNATDDETYFFPEIMFPFNCVPESALSPIQRAEKSYKAEFNGVLDHLPPAINKSAFMIERLGIGPECLSMEQGGRGKNGSEGGRKLLSPEQASEMSKKVVARVLTNVGFEGSSERSVQVLSEVLTDRISELGGKLKVLADSYRKECTAVELIKMFLHISGNSNLGALAEIVRASSRNPVQQSPQQIQIIQAHMQSQRQQQPQQQLQQQQPQLRHPQQVPRSVHPQMQQMLQQAYQPQLQQQQQQWERMQRLQQAMPRAGPGMNTNMDNVRPMVKVKLENQSEFPVDNNAFSTINARNPQMQFRQQQLAGMGNFPQSGNQFRQMASVQIPQVQSPNMSTVRAQPVKVEGFQELMGGDASLKHDSEENKLTSPSK